MFVAGVDTENNNGGEKEGCEGRGEERRKKSSCKQAVCAYASQIATVSVLCLGKQALFLSVSVRGNALGVFSSRGVVRSS